MSYPPGRYLVPYDADPKYRYRLNPFQTNTIREVFDPRLAHVRVHGIDGANRLGKSGAGVFYLRAMMKANPPGVNGIWLVPSIPWFKAIGHEVVKQIFATGKRGSSGGELEVNINLSSPIRIRHKQTGASVIVHSYDALERLEGATAGYALIDESQLMGPEVIEMLLSRLSDKRAAFSKILILGIPSGPSWVEDKLAELGSVALYRSGFGTALNAENLVDGYIETLASGLTADEQEYRLHGRRPRAVDGAFNEWSTLNVIDDWQYDPTRRCLLMTDPGFRRSGLILAQVMPDGSAVVFDEYNSDNASTEAVIAHSAARLVHRSEASWRESNVAVAGARVVFDEIAIDSAGDSPNVTTGLSCVQAWHARYPSAVIHFDKHDRSRAERTLRIKRWLCAGLPGREVRRLKFTRAFWDRSINDRRDNGDDGRKVKKAYGRSLALSLTRLQYPKAKNGRIASDAYIECPIDAHCADALGYGLKALETQRVHNGVR